MIISLLQSFHIFPYHYCPNVEREKAQNWLIIKEKLGD
jgi:hypothetical protein